MKEKVELEKNLEEYKLANNTIKKAHEDLKKEYVTTFNENIFFVTYEIVQSKIFKQIFLIKLEHFRSKF